MRRLLLGLSLVAAASCGGKEGDDGKDVAEVLRFSMQLDEARQDGQVGPDEKAEDVRRETVRAVGLRLERFRLSPSRASADGADGIAVTIPRGADRETLVECLSRRGEVEFRIEVRPAYSEFQGYRGEKRAREKVWVGASGTSADGEAASFNATERGFDAYKADEVKRYFAAETAKTIYVPLDARYRVAPKEVRGYDSAPESGPDRFAVLEEPKSPDDRFGNEILESVSASPDMSGLPGVLYNVASRYQDAFARWTGANVGLPLAIVVDGEVLSAPILNSSLRTSVIVTMGSRFFRNSEGTLEIGDRDRAAKALAMAIGNRPMRVRLELRKAPGEAPKPR